MPPLHRNYTSSRRARFRGLGNRAGGTKSSCPLAQLDLDLGSDSDVFITFHSSTKPDASVNTWASVVTFYGPMLRTSCATLVPMATSIRLTMRWSERRTAVRSSFEMISTLSLRVMRALVRRRSSWSR